MAAVSLSALWWRVVAVTVLTSVGWCTVVLLVASATLALSRTTGRTTRSLALVALSTAVLTLSVLLLAILTLLRLSFLCRSDVARALLGALHGRLRNELTRLNWLSSNDWRNCLIAAARFVLEAIAIATRSAAVRLTLAAIAAALSVSTSLALAVTATLTTTTACRATTAAIQ